MPGPARAAERIRVSISLGETPRDIKDVLTDLILDEGWEADRNDAAEKAEKWKTRTLKRLRDIQSDYLEVGRPVSYDFNSSSDYMVQGACFIEPGDSPELQAKKSRRLGFSDYYRALQELTPTDLEVLCGRLIELLGVESPVVTRHSADEGIDFFGQLSLDSILLPQDLSPTLQRQLKIWMVGQAKHYQETQSGTPELRELIGSIALGRAKAYGSQTDPLEGLKLRVADPVFAIFITTGSISSSGWRLLGRSGIVGFDGEMVAAFLADRAVGINAGAFDQAAFDTWLNT